MAASAAMTVFSFWGGGMGSRFDRTYYVYILASKRNGTLYIGVTNDLARRVEEHRVGAPGSFTTRYGVTRLVWFEAYGDVEEAILRETRMKKWKRAWKIEVIEAMNPEWGDLIEAGWVY
jgi:putative endonuclease